MAAATAAGVASAELAQPPSRGGDSTARRIASAGAVAPRVHGESPDERKRLRGDVVEVSLACSDEQEKHLKALSAAASLKAWTTDKGAAGEASGGPEISSAEAGEAIELLDALKEANVTVEVLHETGIGKEVSRLIQWKSLCIASRASGLVIDWKCRIEEAFFGPESQAFVYSSSPSSPLILASDAGTSSSNKRRRHSEAEAPRDKIPASEGETGSDNNTIPEDSAEEEDEEEESSLEDTQDASGTDEETILANKRAIHSRNCVKQGLPATDFIDSDDEWYAQFES